MLCIRAVVVEIEVEGLEVFLKDQRRLPEGLNVAEEEEQTITGNLGFFSLNRGMDGGLLMKWAKLGEDVIVWGQIAVIIQLKNSVFRFC